MIYQLILVAKFIFKKFTKFTTRAIMSSWEKKKRQKFCTYRVNFNKHTTIMPTFL